MNQAEVRQSKQRAGNFCTVAYLYRYQVDALNDDDGDNAYCTSALLCATVGHKIFQSWKKFIFGHMSPSFTIRNFQGRGRATLASIEAF
jgi:hypothetical protein